MSRFLERLRFFDRKKDEFADGFGVITNEDRSWEEIYRQQWQYDKIVRSTHGCNCTGSCSWKVYVKDGFISREVQQTDYPRTRPDIPNHEPRGCQRGASYSWYTYGANRIKYPMIRKTLLTMWRDARKSLSPVDAWASVVESTDKATAYKKARGMGGFIRSSWDEVNEIIAAANIYTIKQYGPDRIIGFSPIPAMSMVSYAAGSRYLSLIGGTCMSFYDWYCDLPPSSPMTWGEQTDVPESADWYNSTYIIVWGSNVPQTRTPDAHFLTEVRYKGAKTVVITPDYSEAARFGDIWLSPKQGTDSALALALGHVILKEYFIEKPRKYFIDYCLQYSDMPMLVLLEEHGNNLFKSGRFLRASDFSEKLCQGDRMEWKTLVWDEISDNPAVPNGSIGFRWDKNGLWNLDNREALEGKDIRPLLSFIDCLSQRVQAAFPYFGGDGDENIVIRTIPVRKIVLKDGKEALVTTVFDLMTASYGIERKSAGEVSQSTYDDEAPYTPAWQEKMTGIARERVTGIAREFAENAEKTGGKSMIIVGAALNHWYHGDMSYRGLINVLIMCGCVGKSGGGWAHYVGQEKLRPQTGWLPLAFGLDWHRPPRHMNSTSFFYAHSEQWRHEKLNTRDILSPLVDKESYPEHPIDWNVKAERMGWLPSAPQLNRNPLHIAGEADSAGMETEEFLVNNLKSGNLSFASEMPEDPKNFPRNIFVWRSNVLGSSSKGHEYFLKYLLGTRNGVMNDGLNNAEFSVPEEVKWHENPPEGKLDLVVTLDFRMSSTCVYSDIVLPCATWYEKDDLSTTDMHPFIHPLTKAAEPAWEARSDWDIFKGIAAVFSRMSKGILGSERDVVMVPILHDTPGELAQAIGIRDWKKGECDPVPGKTMPNIFVVERHYPDTFKKFTSLGPLMEKIGNGSKGISWKTDEEVELVGRLNKRVVENGVSLNRPVINSPVDAAEVILSLAPETNGHVAVKAWKALEGFTGKEHSHLAVSRESEKIGFHDLKAQPRKIITSPTWSGIEDESVTYNAGYTNINESIPWRTLTGRQQFYQDHEWMAAFGEQLVVYKPPIDTKSIDSVKGKNSAGNREIVLNWITPHQKWGIHSMYSENLIMQTLSRGGPVVWISEKDAKEAKIRDNDQVEIFNSNGALTCRAVVSQRIGKGMILMYHAQERILNIPGSETTGTRGGHHNSVTKVVTKPTHMIGGYAHQSYGFNYYGTVGCNRDEFVVVRKMSHVDWLEGK